MFSSDVSDEYELLSNCASVCVYWLASDVIKKRLEIKETKEGVKVQDCQVRVCNNVHELAKALAEGNKAKATGETLMNRDSSRSHCIFTIFVETAVNQAVRNSSSHFSNSLVYTLFFWYQQLSSKKEQTIRMGKLNLVDLAGSEK